MTFSNSVPIVLMTEDVGYLHARDKKGASVSKDAFNKQWPYSVRVKDYCIASVKTLDEAEEVILTYCPK